jgi:hypothetical protein
MKEQSTIIFMRKGFCHFSCLIFYKKILLMISQFIFDAFSWALVTTHT